MEAKDVFWNYFQHTGTIGSYLLSKQLENSDYQGEQEAQQEFERLPFDAGSGTQGSGLQGK